jgi:hypothetical protein
VTVGAYWSLIEGEKEVVIGFGKTTDSLGAY